MKIAGRCLCGMVEEWVAKNPDEHLACLGIKWCKRRCGSLIRLDQKCPCVYFKPANETKVERDKRRDRIRQERRYARKRFLRSMGVAA